MFVVPPDTFSSDILGIKTDTSCVRVMTSGVTIVSSLQGSRVQCEKVSSRGMDTGS